MSPFVFERRGRAVVVREVEVLVESIEEMAEVKAREVEEESSLGVVLGRW
jgi:hypothetical protein